MLPIANGLVRILEETGVENLVSSKDDLGLLDKIGIAFKGLY